MKKSKCKSCDDTGWKISYETYDGPVKEECYCGMLSKLKRRKEVEEHCRKRAKSDRSCFDVEEVRHLLDIIDSLRKII